MRSILFCNEMLGLGHLRRALTVAGALVARDGRSTALVVSGSPAFAGLPVPDRVDILKIPAAPVEVDSQWGKTERRPRVQLRMDPRQLLSLRGELSLSAVRALNPQLALVDYKPLGRGDELRPALQWLRAQSGRAIALGLRDIDDSDERLRAYWSDDLVRTVCRLFDLALVYGDHAADDVRVGRLRASGLPVHRTALVGAPTADRGPEDLGEGYLLVTAGGGVDGYPLLDTVLSAIRGAPLEIPVVLISGPLMSPSEVARVRERAAGLDVRVEESRTDMEAVLAGARAVVSMAGYATVAEILGSGKPALLVPRSSPREEQLNRARRWAAAGRVRMLEPEALEPAALRRAITTLLDRPPSAMEPLTGAADAAAILADAAETAARRPRRRPGAQAVTPSSA